MSKVLSQIPRCSKNTYKSINPQILAKKYLQPEVYPFILITGTSFFVFTDDDAPDDQRLVSKPYLGSGRVRVPMIGDQWLLDDG